ncbi:MAG: glycoside hydrolase [Ruminococcus flavefaciens]|nr:glycoside hydrolase [Ruminococcus flavefaciens]MCM1231626.1 glycoside hydrolase [Ruminococcus flavefaciens]
MKRFKSLLTAMVLTVTAVPITFTATAVETSYDMNVTVDFSGETKEISPYIYGINHYGHQDDMKNMTVTALRQGGNRMTAYNWENNASNAGSDWKHSSDNNLSSSDRPADCVQKFSDEATKYNVDYKLATLQLAGYVSADKDGIVTEEESAPSDRWNEVVITKNAPFDDEPDLTDGKVYMDEYVNYIINKLGDSTSATGIQAYSLDNEPALWAHTHPRIHPEPVTIAEIAEKSISMASAVKKLDPNAEIFGPALYGYTAYDHLADDDDSDEWETIRDENNYHWYLDCYLDQMKKASDEEGVRLLDVLDIHYYSESARVSAEDRVQSVRTLYEKGFEENSWIGQWCQANVPILPTIQASIDKYYPGTKLGITEYHFGGDDDPSGAIAQAEALGCYADHNVYFASLWGGSGYTLSAINLYTNYNGKGGSFGDTLLSTSTEDVSKSSAYASIDSDDSSEVTVMVTNKDMNAEENASIVLKGTDTEYKSAGIYAIYGDSSDIRLLDVVDVADNEVNVTLPAFSVAMVVVSDDENAFDGEQKADEIQKEEKTVTFDDPMSLVNKNGFVEVPIEDPEHLKKVILTADVTSSAGSGWGTAGCAVCINAVDDNGEDFWTSKSYTLGLGSGSKATILFDGTLSKDEEDVSAIIADGKIELQKWWEASEKQELEVEDIISVSYTSIQVVYEYDNSQPTTSEGDVTLLGDANEDGIVDVADAAAIIQSLGNKDKYALSEQGKINADCYNPGDGVTGMDALAIQKLKAKLIKSLPEIE